MALDVELAKESNLNPNVVLTALESLKTMWPLVVNVNEFRSRLMAIFALLQDRMADACGKAVANGETKKVEALLSFAQRCDQVREVAEGDPQLCERLAEEIGGFHLSAVEMELQKTTGMNALEVLKCLKMLPAIWSSVSSDSMLRSRIVGIHSEITTRMKDAFEVATDKRKLDALIQFGGEFDTVFSAVNMDSNLKQDFFTCDKM